jgi:hypothetical protein
MDARVARSEPFRPEIKIEDILRQRQSLKELYSDFQPTYNQLPLHHQKSLRSTLSQQAIDLLT